MTCARFDDVHMYSATCHYMTIARATVILTTYKREERYRSFQRIQGKKLATREMWASKERLMCCCPKSVLSFVCLFIRNICFCSLTAKLLEFKNYCVSQNCSMLFLSIFFPFFLFVYIFQEAKRWQKLFFFQFKTHVYILFLIWNWTKNRNSVIQAKVCWCFASHIVPCKHVLNFGHFYKRCITLVVQTHTVEFGDCPHVIGLCLTQRQ